MEYKKIYDPQELHELIEWFRVHHDELPESIHINNGVFVKDVRHTSSIFKDIVAKVGTKKMYGAHIRLFFTLREQIIAQWEKEKFEKEAESVPV
ncbi:MAG: hypothetical protein IKT92_02790 [Bacteroidaceae bacterium]|nr:hypothetical protein [Bacteroidaceae bacterium]